LFSVDVLNDLPLKGVNREGKSRETLISFLNLASCRYNLISTKINGVAEMVVNRTSLVKLLRIERINLIS